MGADAGAGGGAWPGPVDGAVISIPGMFPMPPISVPRPIAAWAEMTRLADGLYTKARAQVDENLV